MTCLVPAWGTLSTLRVSLCPASQPQFLLQRPSSLAWDSPSKGKLRDQITLMFFASQSLETLRLFRHVLFIHFIYFIFSTIFFLLWHFLNSSDNLSSSNSNFILLYWEHLAMLAWETLWYFFNFRAIIISIRNKFRIITFDWRL